MKALLLIISLLGPLNGLRDQNRRGVEGGLGILAVVYPIIGDFITKIGEIQAHQRDFMHGVVYLRENEYIIG